MNRQKLLLTILVGIFVLALVYAFWAAPRQAKVAGTGPRRPAAPSPQAVATKPSAEDETRVKLELLARENEASPDFKRNIFRFWQPAPKPLPLPPPPPPPPVPAGEILAPAEIQKELARFTFLGFLLRDGVKTIFLSSSEEIFVVKKGDRFGKNGRFLVTELTPEALTIRQNDDPRPITVPLVEQAPLVEAPIISPSQGPPSRSVPTRRRPFVPSDRTEEDLPQAEPEQPVEPTQPTQPTQPAGEAVPVKDPFSIELTPPQGVAPSEDPND
jgi:hypothetical protein